MGQQNIAVIETHSSGHHPSYLPEVLTSAASLSPKRLVLLAQESIITDCEREQFSLPRNTETHILAKLPGYKNFKSLKVSWGVFNFRRFLAYQKAISKCGMDPNNTLAIFPTIYDNEFACFSGARLAFPYKIAGIYMNSHFFRGRADLYRNGCPLKQPSFLKDPRISSIAVLDESIIKPARLYAPNAHFGLVPDFVRITPGIAGRKWNDLVQSAGKRPIVGLFGFLKRSKGLLKFKEASLRLADDAIFVAAGELPESDYTHAELSELRARSADSCSPFHLIEGKITYGAFQAMVQQTAIVSCAYEDFLSSSNQFSTAIAYGKYAVIPQSGCMTDLAITYRNGIAVNDERIESLCAAFKFAIKSAAELPHTNAHMLEARARLSESAFRSAFAKVLADTRCDSAA